MSVKHLSWSLNPSLSIFSLERMGPCPRVWSWLAVASQFRVLWSVSMQACMNVSSPITVLKQCCSSISQFNPMLYSLVGGTLCKYFLHEYVTNFSALNVLLSWNFPSAPFFSVPPTIRVDLQAKDGHRVIECSAADAVPAANVSWLLPKGVSGVSWSNFSSHNGSHSVRGVFLLPACLPWELTAECVINHPAFEEPENRSITLPLCGMFNKSSNG